MEQPSPQPRVRAKEPPSSGANGSLPRQIWKTKPPGPSQESLQEAISLANERIRQLEDMLRPNRPYGKVFGLTRTQSRLLSALHSRPDRIVPYHDLAVLGSTVADVMSDEVIKIHICHIRPILAKFGITIENSWGVGYYLTREMAGKIDEHLSPHAP